METRQAFQIFIRHQLKFAVEEGLIDLTKAQLESFARDVEDDPDFHEGMAAFIAEYIEDFGDNYDLY